MSGGIFLLDPVAGELTEMAETAFAAELDLQKLLADHPGLLPGDQIDPGAPRRWLLVSREAGIPDQDQGGARWALDHLFLDQDGVPTLVEVKRGTDPRTRREVVSQMLDYAANCVLHWTAESIQGWLAKRCQEEGDLDPDEQIALHLGESAATGDFWQRVKTNLKAGKIRLLFVSDAIPPELRRIVEFLNEQMDPAEVLAVEIRQYTGKGLKTLVPRVLGQTVGKVGPPKVSWDEPTFFAELAKRTGEEEVRVAKRILDWAKDRAVRSSAVRSPRGLLGCGPKGGLDIFSESREKRSGWGARMEEVWVEEDGGPASVHLTNTARRSQASPPQSGLDIRLAPSLGRQADRMKKRGPSVNPIVRSPLRWAGSKRRLLPVLMKAVPLDYHRYIEPFAGSACLLFAIQPQAGILGDLNGDLVNFYRVLKRSPRRLAKAVAQLPQTEDFYYSVRSQGLALTSSFNKAVRFLYLNRYCFNGVYRTNRAGIFNVPRGIHTGNIPSAEDLCRCSTALRNIELRAGDFQEVILDAREGDFIYLDPPYTSKSRAAYGEYGYGSFSSQDGERLVGSLRSAQSRGARIILSYKDSTEVREMLPGWHYNKVEVRRHVAGFSRHRNAIAEMVLSSFPIPSFKQGFVV